MQLQDIINDKYVDMFITIEHLIDNIFNIKLLEKNKTLIDTIIISKDFKLLRLLEENKFDINIINIINDNIFLSEYNLYKRTIKIKRIIND